MINILCDQQMNHINWVLLSIDEIWKMTSAANFWWHFEGLKVSVNHAIKS